MKSEVTTDLKNTVENNPHIDQVHFTATGKHYFQVYEKDGRKYGQITKQTVIDKVKNTKKIVETPILSTLIIESVDRDEVTGVKDTKPAKKIKVVE